MAVKRRKERKKKRDTGNRSEYWQECGKKNRYNSPKSAHEAAEKVYRERGVKCHVYKCHKYCGKWHLAENDS